MDKDLFHSFITKNKAQLSFRIIPQPLKDRSCLNIKIPHSHYLLICCEKERQELPEELQGVIDLVRE